MNFYTKKWERLYHNESKEKLWPLFLLFLQNPKASSNSSPNTITNSVGCVSTGKRPHYSGDPNTGHVRYSNG